MAEIEEEDLIVLRSVFQKFDHDGDGYLNISEFVSLVKSLSKYVSEIRNINEFRIKALFAYLDAGMKRQMNFDEFCDWWFFDRYTYITGDTGKRLEKAYSLYSKYASKHGMTYNQFNLLLDDLHIEHTDDAFDEMDRSNDGILNFAEFCSWLGWF